MNGSRVIHLQFQAGASTSILRRAMIPSTCIDVMIFPCWKDLAFIALKE